MIRVGLSGGIGAGKSTVARTFSERGAYLIDADKIAREVVAPGTDGLAELVEAFGEDILAEDGSLDRAALAAKAFVDEEQRQRLNGITHPRVGARTWELLQAAPDDAIVIQDVPLLVEGHMAPFFHLVVIVHADEEVRLRRLTEQRGMAADDARARIRSQATVEQRREVADVWLDNSGTAEDLAALAAALWDERLVPFEANVRAGTPAARDDRHPVPADPAWARQGRRLRDRLLVLAAEHAVGVEHVGPTAEPDRDAPDVIDLLVTARDAAAGDALAAALVAGGFPRVAGEAATHASADPGRPATVRVVDVASGADPTS